MVGISPSWICSSILQSELQKEVDIPLVQTGDDESAVAWGKQRETIGSKKMCYNQKTNPLRLAKVMVPLKLLLTTGIVVDISELCAGSKPILSSFPGSAEKSDSRRITPKCSSFWGAWTPATHPERLSKDLSILRGWDLAPYNES